MEYENYFTEELKPISSSEKSLPCFDCSICLDFAKDPVVTLCGHLYCWPCIYKWLSFQTTSTDSNDTPQCPVCKSEISHTAVVPLYGRGKTDSSNTSPAIPPRPHAALLTTTTTTPTQHFYRHPHHPPYPTYNPSSPELYTHGHGHGVDALNPNVWMYGEMIYARVFGNSQSLYTFPNSYHLAGSSSPRLRRQEMQVHRSLNRLTIFLFCCFFLCLLLF